MVPLTRFVKFYYIINVTGIKVFNNMYLVRQFKSNIMFSVKFLKFNIEKYFILNKICSIVHLFQVNIFFIMFGMFKRYFGT